VQLLDKYCTKIVTAAYDLLRRAGWVNGRLFTDLRAMVYVMAAALADGKKFDGAVWVLCNKRTTRKKGGRLIMKKETIEERIARLIIESDKMKTRPSPPRRKPTARDWRALERLTGFGKGRQKLVLVPTELPSQADITKNYEQTPMTTSGNEYNLNRFVEAQSKVYEQVITELQNGEKRTHWMWFVFPQIAGLGESPTSVLYSIKSEREAVAYLSHPVLGKRLRQCVKVLLSLQSLTALQILGFPDDRKLHSSMTLFAAVSDDKAMFQQVLARYFDRQQDGQTLRLLGRG